MLKLNSTKIAQDWFDEIDRPEQKDNRLVNEGNLNDYLVDEVEDAPEEPEIQRPGQQPPPPPLPEYADYLEEIPTGNELLGIPEDTKEVMHSTPDELVDAGIDNVEVVSFEYTNRHGAYAGLRTLEPHYTFIARTTGNEVLVGYDRDINDIRAFIVGNIHPNGVRYEGVNFEPRPEIMRGVA